jgi:hypothetical protein
MRSRYSDLPLSTTTESGYLEEVDGGTRPLELVTRPLALFLLFALNLGDVFTTGRVLALGGQEGNPLASQLLTHSLNTLLAVKLALVVGIALAALFTPDRHAIRAARWVWFAVLIYGLVVVWNCSQILLYRVS